MGKVAAGSAADAACTGSALFALLAGGRGVDSFFGRRSTLFDARGWLADPLPDGRQEQESADARRRHDPEGDAAQHACRTPAGLATAVALSEMMAEKHDVFVGANILEAKVRSQPLLEEAQRRILQPGEEASARQQHCRCADAITEHHGVVNVLDLPVGEPIQVIEDEQRRSGVRGLRIPRCAIARRRTRKHGRGAQQIVRFQLRPAGYADNCMSRCCRLAEGLAERVRARRRISGD